MKDERKIIPISSEVKAKKEEEAEAAKNEFAVGDPTFRKMPFWKKHAEDEQKSHELGDALNERFKKNKEEERAKHDETDSDDKEQHPHKAA